MRLIDAEALKRSIINQLVDSKKSKRHGVLEIVGECIDYAPTVEAKPVVHAHWKEWYPPKEFVLTGEKRLFICSCCDAKFETVENSRYCPFCGATMDERKGEKE